LKNPVRLIPFRGTAQKCKSRTGCAATRLMRNVRIYAICWQNGACWAGIPTTGYVCGTINNARLL